MHTTQMQFAGSWRLTLRSDAGTQPQFAFATLFAEGALITTPPAVEEFPLSPEGVVYVGTGHGEWRTSGPDQATLAFEAQASNSRGQMIGLGRVEADLVIGDHGNAFTGSYAFAISDPAGEVFATEEGIVEGHRIGVGNIEAQVNDREPTLATS